MDSILNNVGTVDIYASFNNSKVELPFPAKARFEEKNFSYSDYPYYLYPEHVHLRDKNDVTLIISQRYHLMKAFELIDGDYDIVVSLRHDAVFHEKIVFIKDDKLHIPIGQDWRGGINDQFAYGNKNTMHFYAQQFNCITFICRNLPLHSETITRHTISLFKLKLERFPLKYELFQNRHEIK